MEDRVRARGRGEGRKNGNRVGKKVKSERKVRRWRIKEWKGGGRGGEEEDGMERRRVGWRGGG